MDDLINARLRVYLPGSVGRPLRIQHKRSLLTMARGPGWTLDRSDREIPVVKIRHRWCESGESHAERLAERTWDEAIDGDVGRGAPTFGAANVYSRA